MRGPLQRIASWRWFRVAAPFLVGTALFLMGVVYLNLNRTVDQPGFYLSGGSHGVAGKPAAFRLSAKYIDSSRSLPATLSAVRIDGKPTEFTVTASPMSPVQFQLPTDAIQDTVRVDLDVRAGQRTETVGFDLPILQSSGDVVISGLEEAVSKVATSSDALRVDVLPDNGVLALGMTNSVLLRVRDARGKGIPGVTIRVMHKTCLIPPGPLTLQTDAMGLAEFKLVARQPGITLKLELQRPNAPPSKREELLQPRGRRALISVAQPVVAPGTAIKAVVETWEERADLYCDVTSDGAVLWSGNFQSEGHRLELSIDVPCEGRCDLQCTGHPWEPGEEFATFPLFITNEPSLKVLSAHLEAQRMLHPGSLRVVPGADVARTSRYFATLLKREPLSPRLWVNTRPEDIEKRSSAASAEKRRILMAMAAVFVLVLLVVLDVVLRNTAAQRRRMREFAAETLGEEVSADVMSALSTQGEQAKLDRTRGALLMVAMLGALIGNLVGIIWLLDLVGAS